MVGVLPPSPFFPLFFFSFFFVGLEVVPALVRSFRSQIISPSFWGDAHARGGRPMRGGACRCAPPGTRRCHLSHLPGILPCCVLPAAPCNYTAAAAAATHHRRRRAVAVAATDQTSTFTLIGRAYPPVPGARAHPICCDCGCAVAVAVAVTVNPVDRPSSARPTVPHSSARRRSFRSPSTPCVRA